MPTTTSNTDPAAPATYSWRLLRAAEFRLDAGSMFGLIPRAVWSRTVPTDERGRMTLNHNCLLLERSEPFQPSVTPSPRHSVTSLTSPKLVLIETGTGDKLDPKSRDIFALEDRSITAALHEADCRPEDIGAVIVSHLHFDHAGGLTRRVRPGETPDWTGPSSAGGEAGVKLTFPNAAVHAQQREWDDALPNRSVMTRTYFPDHLEPIKDHIRRADSPRPFPPSYTPDRDELPASHLSARETEILPAITVFLIPGHTWGQQAVKFTDTQRRTVVFTPDVLPTVHHAGQAYSLGYDVEPYTSMITRRWFLQAAADNNWLLALDHEPGNPLHHVRPNTRGWFDLVATDA